MSDVVICLAETSLDSWEARFPYLSAKAEKKRLELYNMDLMWLLAKRHYSNLPQPSEIATETKIRDTRSAEQIKQDLLHKLGGDT